MKQVEVMVVGGGPAGLCAALAASSLGAKVLLAERDGIPGGQLVKQTHKFFGSEKQYAGDRGIHIGKMLLDNARSDKNIEIWADSTVLAIYDDGVVTVEHESKHAKVKPERIIIATGAAEKFLSFPGNDLPGIYGAGAVQTLMNVDGVKPAQRVLMVGAGNIGLIVSYQLQQAGVEVAAVIEGLPKIGGYLVHASKIQRAGIPVLTRHTILEAYGSGMVEGAVIAKIDDKWQPIPGTEQKIPCDTICLAVGLSPLTELAWQAGCKMEFIRELSGHVPIVGGNLESTAPGIYCAGDVSGIEEASAAMVEGRLAGISAAASLGYGGDISENLIREATDELEELRAGPLGAHIRAGMEKMRRAEQKALVRSADIKFGIRNSEFGITGRGLQEQPVISLRSSSEGELQARTASAALQADKPPITEAAPQADKPPITAAALQTDKAPTASTPQTNKPPTTSTLLSDGIPTKADLEAIYPPDERMAKGPVAIVECFQEIPCNPCVKACRRGAITMPHNAESPKPGSPAPQKQAQGEHPPQSSINDLPVVDAELCNGCGLCISLCPGLAIFVVDKAWSDDRALVKLPFEYVPVPEQGQYAAGLDRAGRELGWFEVVKVTSGGKKNMTWTISLAVPRSLAMEVRCIRIGGYRS